MGDSPRVPRHLLAAILNQTKELGGKNFEKFSIWDRASPLKSQEEDQKGIMYLG